MLKRKMLSWFLVVVMLVAYLPILSLAALKPGTQKAKAELLYLEYNEGISDKNILANPGAVTVKPPKLNLKSGDEILVGIRLSDISNIVESDSGVYGSNITLKYNPDILQCEDNKNLRKFVGARVASQNNPIYKEFDGLVEYDIAKGAISSISDYNITGEADGCTAKVNVAFNFYTTEVLPRYIGNEDILVGAVKFKVKATPSKGTKVVGFALRDQTQGGHAGFQTIGFGRGNGAGAYEFKKLGYDTRDVIEFLDEGVDFFPAEKVLTYHDNVSPGDPKPITGGSVEGETQGVPKGKSLNEVGLEMLPGPTRNGYVFKGWFENPGGSGSMVTAYTKINNDKDLYAKWEEGYTVTFHANGGGLSTGGEVKTVDKGKGIKLNAGDIPVASRNGYTYENWGTKANGTGTNIPKGNLTSYDFKNKNETLYPIWNLKSGEDKVTVEFDGNVAGKNINVKPSSVSLKKGDKIGLAMPDKPERAGYIFKEWNTKKNGTGSKFDGNTAVDKNKKVYAQWTADPANPKNVTVTFNSNNATFEANPKSVTIKAGDKVGNAMPDEPKKDGYTFKGWEKDDHSIFDENTVVNDSVTVTAKWSNDVKIKLDPNGGTLEPGVSDTITAKMGEAIGDSLPTADKVTRDEYRFKGWNTKSNGTGKNYTSGTIVTGAKTLYAKWEAKNGPNKAVVTFDGNGADIQANPAMVTVKKGDALEGRMPDVPTREKYVFVKWNTKANGAGKDFDGHTAVTGNMTVYAQWKPASTNPDEVVTIAFEAPEAAVQANPKTITIVKGDIIEEEKMPDPPIRDDNYIFTEWHDEDGVPFTGETTVNKNMKVFAQWKKGNMPVEFKANGGKFKNPPGSISKIIEVMSGEAIADKLIKSTEVEREGYTLKEWNEKANGSGNKIDASTVIDQKITAYAIWKATTGDQVTVTFNDNPIVGDVSKPSNPKKVTVNKNDSIGSMMPDNPEMNEYDFKGWYTDKAGVGDRIEATTGIKESMTVYAKWEAKGGVADGNNVILEFYFNKKNIASDKSEPYVKAQKIVRKTDVSSLTTDKIYPFSNDNEAKKVLSESDSRAGYKFAQWKLADGTDFNPSSTAPNGERKIEFFATWEAKLTLKPISVEADYDGIPKLFDITEVKGYDDKTLSLVQGEDYELVFKNRGTESETTIIQDAGTYDVVRLNAKKVHTNADLLVLDAVSSMNHIKINAKAVKLIITSDQELKADGNTAQQIEGTVEPAETGVVFKYFKAEKASDGKVTKGEEVEQANLKEYGEYIVEAVTKNPNYVINEVSAYGGKELLTYSKDIYEAGETAKNLKLVIMPAVKLTGIKVENSEGKTLNLYDKAEDVLPSIGVDFDKSTKDYYVSVKHNEDVKVTFEGEFSGSSVQVRLNDNNVNVIDKANGKQTENNLDLNPLNPVTQINAGDKFGNELTIKVGEETFKVHIRKLLKPELKLNYGNSPVAEILKDSGIADKEAAIAEFKIKNCFVNQSNTPKSILKEFGNRFHLVSREMYPRQAWFDIKDDISLDESEILKAQDENINLDINKEVVFAYEGTEFIDPGFTATNSLGRNVEATQEINLSRFKATGYKNLGVEFVPDKWQGTNSGKRRIITGITGVDPGEKSYVIPNIYEMKHSFTDVITGEKIEVSRKVVILFSQGDTDLTGEITFNDIGTLETGVGLNKLPVDIYGNNKQIERIITQKIYDIDFSKIVTFNDIGSLETMISNISGIQKMYPEIR